MTEAPKGSHVSLPPAESRATPEIEAFRGASIDFFLPEDINSLQTLAWYSRLDILGIIKPGQDAKLANQYQKAIYKDERAWLRDSFLRPSFSHRTKARRQEAEIAIIQADPKEVFFLGLPSDHSTSEELSSLQEKHENAVTFFKGTHHPVTLMHGFIEQAALLHKDQAYMMFNQLAGVLDEMHEEFSTNRVAAPLVGILMYHEDHLTASLLQHFAQQEHVSVTGMTLPLDPVSEAVVKTVQNGACSRENAENALIFKLLTEIYQYRSWFVPRNILEEDTARATPLLESEQKATIIELMQRTKSLGRVREYIEKLGNEELSAFLNGNYRDTPTRDLTRGVAVTPTASKPLV